MDKYRYTATPDDYDGRESFSSPAERDLQTVKLFDWEPVPGKEGYTTPKPRPIATVLNALNAALERRGLLPDEYGFNLDSTTRYNHGAGAPWPMPNDYYFIACYAVTGGSEGHYIHIELLGPEQRKAISLGKTFQGLAHAIKIAGACTELLGA